MRLAVRYVVTLLSMQFAFGHAGSSHGAAHEGNGVTIPAPIATPADASVTGKKLYGRYCAACHGANGTGEEGPDSIPVSPPDLTDGAWIYGGSDMEIFASIRKGVAPNYYMPPWPQISDADTLSLVRYIRELAKRKLKTSGNQTTVREIHDASRST